MKDYLNKAIAIVNSFIVIMKTIFAIFKIDEPEFDLTGEGGNLETIETELGKIVDQLS